MGQDWSIYVNQGKFIDIEGIIWQPGVEHQQLEAFLFKIRTIYDLFSISFEVKRSFDKDKGLS